MTLPKTLNLFVDDCILYRVIKSESDCITLQADIDCLHLWATTWQMQFLNFLSSVDSYPYLSTTVSSNFRLDKHTVFIPGMFPRGGSNYSRESVASEKAFKVIQKYMLN